jgi:hypothetical protein
MSMAPSHPRRPTFAAVLLTVGLALAAPVATFAQGPSISVEPASIGPGSTTLTVTGSGFSTTGNGVYVVFGPIATAPVYYSDPSIYGAFRWVHAGAGESPAEAVLAPDGSFSTTLEVTSTFTTPAGDIDCATSVCAVITFAAHGSPDRSQDTCVPLLGGRIASPTGAGADASPGDGVASWATDPCAPITGDPAASAAPVGPSVPSVAP